MRTIIAALMGTISGLVLLFSYHTSTGTQAATVAATSTEDGQSAATTPNAGDSEASSSSDGATESTSESSIDDGTSTSSTAGSVSGTFTGAAVETRYGAVQVEITVENGVITSSEAIQYPNRDRHDRQINAYAVPVLNSEAVDAQSADIDSVSGATFTSVGYAQSLQSAIDEAFQ